jgi:hypothetical protein
MPLITIRKHNLKLEHQLFIIKDWDVQFPKHKC